MSINCNRCRNKVFDSNAYLKILEIERKQQDKINKIRNTYNNSNTYEKSIKCIELLAEEKVLKAIQECKNSLY